MNIYNIFEKNLINSFYKFYNKFYLIFKDKKFFSIYNKIALSYSGGLDSSCLLDMLIIFTKKFKIKLFVFYINHNININSNLWQNFCKKKCLFLNIFFESYSLKININNKKKSEEILRIKRYFALKKLCKKNNIKLLLTAHHKNDQIETILFRILRGSGILGISGMHKFSKIPIFIKNIKIFIFRPLLNISRKSLENYVNNKNISYIKDNSNKNNKYKRNLLRNKIIPFFIKKFPGFKKSILRILYHSKTTEKLLKNLAKNDLKKCIKNNNLNILKVKNLLNIKRIDNLLRYWFKFNNLYLPSTAFLKEFRRQIINFKLNSNIFIKYQNIYIRSYQNYIFITNISYNFKKKILLQTFYWKGEIKINFPNFFGLLYFKKNNYGISINWLLKQKLFIRYKNNKDKIKLYKKKFTKKLKKIYQENKIPSWERNYLPIISLKNNKIIYASGIGINFIFKSILDPKNNYVILYWKNIFPKK
ncbi:tRNA lysidine(34) synthetase TilS [Candidatus Zinderia endosymbiont of Aphrophora alni]|uniref:tRNA lysidine(34) synthetase TilS n=1 Tax=Candidatus Zinderia endosymbiont of Aphrophora alni TaxID=3077951 RepID=UPI0030CA770E